jgi:hypothetical protein
MATRSLSKTARAKPRASVVPLKVSPFAFDEEKFLEVVRGLNDDQKDRIFDLAYRAATGEESSNCDTGPQVLAFLASMRPMRGCDVDDDQGFHRGRALIERLALSAQEEGPPRLRFTLSQAADVMRFLGRIEPIEQRDWWNDPKDGPSHVCGYTVVLDAIEDSLRAGRRS